MNEDSLEIARLSLRNGRTDLGMLAICAGESVAQFRQRLVLAGAARSPELGMSRQEIASYSLSRAISGAQAANDGRIGGLEGVVSDELAKRFERPTLPHHVHIPVDVIRHHTRNSTRALAVGTTTTGGYLVETENLGFVGLALARSVFGPLGVQVLEGLTGNISIPVLKSPGSQTVLPTESTQASTVSQTFGQVALTPRSEGTYTEVSRLLMLQSSASAQSFIAQQLLAAFAAQVEKLALTGTGITGQVTGLINAAANSVTGTSLALSGLLSAQTQTGDRLGPFGGYVTTQAVAALLAARQKASNTSSFLWEGSAYQGVMAGFPALSTSNMPAANLLFGNWNMALLASWGTLSLEVNPVANFQAGLVGLRIFHSFDFAALDPAAFSLASGVT